jgi:hypothetical protein
VLPTWLESSKIPYAGNIPFSLSLFELRKWWRQACYKSVRLGTFRFKFYHNFWNYVLRGLFGVLCIQFVLGFGGKLGENWGWFGGKLCSTTTT